MRGMLRTPEGRGYPADYLRARLRGRAEYLIADWDRLLAVADPALSLPPAPWRDRTPRSEEGVWRGALREFTWVYGQMEPRLRERLAPLFCWFELRTIILVLRLREGGDDPRADTLLDESLLAPGVRRALRGGGNLGEAVAATGNLFAEENEKFRGLAETFRREGRPGVEGELVTLWLEGVAAERLHHPLGELFRRLIDLRNVVTLAKELRWRPTASPPFVRGGSLSPALLGEIATRGEPEALLPLLGRLAGRGVGEWTAANPEPPLLEAVTGEVRRWGREAGGIGPILDHLWRCYLEARNLGLLVHGGDLDRETIRRELVQ